jgi:G6PDH family F420-dependent oxidoreductase
MVNLGYTVNSEQAGPIDLVEHGVLAEEAGFDFLAVSDHYSPWLETQGHAPNAWVVLGALAHVTKDIPLTSFVTCPTIRYNPVVVAQQAATMQILSEGRFFLGLGSGENLNEHVMGQGWPHVDTRHAMLVEATQIIQRLLDGETVTYRGKYFQAEAAKLWDLPEKAPAIGIAASGPKSCKIAGKYGDFFVGVEPRKKLLSDFDKHGGKGKGRMGQVLISWDPDRDTAIKRAHEQAPWISLGWGAITGLATPKEFKDAARLVTPEEVAASMPCGPDIAPIVEAVRAFVDVGYTSVALLQVGGETQADFIKWAEKELMPELRQL